MVATAIPGTSVCIPDCRNNLVKNKVSVEDDARYEKSLG